MGIFPTGSGIWWTGSSPSTAPADLCGCSIAWSIARLVAWLVVGPDADGCEADL
jgi:hypothetical protein